MFNRLGRVAALLSVTVWVFSINASGSLTFVCSSQNDVFLALKNGGEQVGRFDSVAEAINRARENSGVLILAERYPTNKTELPADVLQRAASKNLRLYIEFPEALPGLQLGKPRGTAWERGIVSSEAFGPRIAEDAFACDSRLSFHSGAG
jgi:hypothetical protein